jgi:hypothetical protein
MSVSVLQTMSPNVTSGGEPGTTPGRPGGGCGGGRSEHLWQSGRAPEGLQDTACGGPAGKRRRMRSGPPWRSRILRGVARPSQPVCALSRSPPHCSSTRALAPILALLTNLGARNDVRCEAYRGSVGRMDSTPRMPPHGICRLEDLLSPPPEAFSSFRGLFLPVCAYGLN